MVSLIRTVGENSTSVLCTYLDMCAFDLPPKLGGVRDLLNTIKY